MTLKPICKNAETMFGVPLTVTGVAQVKIMRDPELLQNASEQFLGKGVVEIKKKVLQTLEGHLRAILGTLTVEEIYRNREKFAHEVMNGHMHSLPFYDSSIYVCRYEKLLLLMLVEWDWI